MSEPVSLEVEAVKEGDWGFGTARLDTATRARLGVKVGDIIEIRGRTVSHALVAKAYAEDEGSPLVAIDQVTCWNVGAAVGERVELVASSCPPAVEVILVPVRDRLYDGVQVDEQLPEALKKFFDGRPVTRGDVVMSPSVKLSGESLAFAVLRAVPEGTCIIDHETEVHLLDKPLWWEGADALRGRSALRGLLDEELLKEFDRLCMGKALRDPRVSEAIRKGHYSEGDRVLLSIASRVRGGVFHVERDELDLLDEGGRYSVDRGLSEWIGRSHAGLTFPPVLANPKVSVGTQAKGSEHISPTQATQS